MKLEYTGERVVPNIEEAKENLQTHLEFYKLVYKYVEKKEILDLGCGCGYGSFELSKIAKNVIGVDRSIEAIQFSRENYKSKNLDFLVSSILLLSV